MVSLGPNELKYIMFTSKTSLGLSIFGLHHDLNNEENKIYLQNAYLNNKKLQQTTKNTFGPGTHFPDDQSIRI